MGTYSVNGGAMNLARARMIVEFADQFKTLRHNPETTENDWVALKLSTTPDHAGQLLQRARAAVAKAERAKS
jgi:hypothetical protein